MIPFAKFETNVKRENYRLIEPIPFPKNNLRIKKANRFSAFFKSIRQNGRDCISIARFTGIFSFFVFVFVALLGDVLCGVIAGGFAFMSTMICAVILAFLASFGALIPQLSKPQPKDYWAKRQRIWPVLLESLGLKRADLALNLKEINQSCLLWDNKFARQIEIASFHLDESMGFGFLGAVASSTRYTAENINVKTPEDEVFQGAILSFPISDFYPQPIQFSELDHFSLPEYKDKLSAIQKEFYQKRDNLDFYRIHTRQKGLPDVFLQKAFMLFLQIKDKTAADEVYIAFYRDKLYVALRLDKLFACDSSEGNALKSFYAQMQNICSVGHLIQDVIVNKDKK